jgi:serine O-acetyltransferase
MRSTLSGSALSAYVERQLAAFFPDDQPHDVAGVVAEALVRVAVCFAPVRLAPYRRDGEPFFDHLHSDQYATFVYLASRVAHERGDRALAAKLYGLNKALNGFMCMYDTLLPPRFLLIHTVGMMLGKATYGDLLVAVHGCTVGTDRGVRPVLGAGVILYGGASVVGDCHLGDNVTVAAHALVRNQSVAAGSVVAGASPALTVKPARRPLIEEFFDVEGGAR